MNEESINGFLKKFSENRHTEREHKIFISWLASAPIEEVQKILDEYQDIAKIQSLLEPAYNPQLIEKIEARLNALNDQEISTEPAVKLWSWLRKTAYVAAILFVISSLGLYFYINRNIDQLVIAKKENGIRKNEISPGGDKAILTLSDGSTIALDSAKNGLLATQSGINISKTANGQIIYKTSLSSTSRLEPSYNTISTPRGGQYQVILPDGTKVWLNAASSLTFPASFSGGERRVKLSGEAYFEVVTLVSPSNGGDERIHIPFRVVSGNQLVEVLGTHFNVNAYPDEATISTTLLEGSVKVMHMRTHHTMLLKPGQESQVGADIQVSNVEVAQAIAWKNGYFVFAYENIESIMRKISRWYDVDIQYEGDITKEGFIGSVSKFENVSQVLDMLRFTGLVHFKVEDQTNKHGQKGRRIIVMP